MKVVQGEVTAIDVAGKKLRLAGGGELPYDRLVLSPGIDFMADQIGGLPAALDSGRVLHAWKAGPQTVALRKQIEAMPDGGVFAMFIPKAPYRCPPGPYERACVVASYLKTAKPKSKVLVLDANPEITSKKALFEKAFKDHYAGMLEYRPNAELKELSGNVAKLEFEDVKADVLNVIPPQRAGDLARSAGLLNMNNRWVGVNWLTMESTAAPGIHVLGDATFPAPLMPKSGHMANQHAKVAAAAIIQLLKGEAGECHAGGDEHLLQLRHRPRGDARGLGAPVRRRGQDLQDRARLGRRVGRGQPDRRPLRAVLGREHLGRLAGALSWSDVCAARRRRRGDCWRVRYSRPLM